MALTTGSNVETTLGNKYHVLADVAFDNSYSIGGEAITANSLGISTIERLLIEPCQGYTFEWDDDNSKIKVFMKAPPIVHEEVVTCTSKVGYLKWPAAHIEYVTDDAQPYLVVPGGVTPAANTVAVDMGFNVSTGVLTKGQRCKLTFSDAVTTAKVSYITQAWKEVTDNMVQACLTSGVVTYGHDDMSFTAGSAVPDIIKLGEDFVALQSVCFNNGGVVTAMTAMVDDATDGAGATEVVVDFRKGSSFGEVSFNETDACDTTGDIVYINYIRDPGSGFLYDRFTNATIADSSDTYTLTGYPLLYCTCGGFPIESTTKKANMTGIATGTLAANEIQWTTHPWYPGTAVAIAGILTAHADTDVDITPAWIAGDPSEIDTVLLECTNGTDLSNLSAVKVTAIGY
jgi:hypothetical protein